jgi:hypothetical protein
MKSNEIMFFIEERNSK